MNRKYGRLDIRQVKYFGYIIPILAAYFIIFEWDNFIDKFPLSLSVLILLGFMQSVSISAWFHPDPVLIIDDEGFCYRIYSEDKIPWKEIAGASVVASVEHDKRGRLIRLNLRNKNSFQPGARMSKGKLFWLSFFRAHNKNPGIIVINTFRMSSAKDMLLNEIERRCGLTIGIYPRWRN